MEEKRQFLSLHASYLPIQILKTSLPEIEGFAELSDFDFPAGFSDFDFLAGLSSLVAFLLISFFGGIVPMNLFKSTEIFGIT